MIKGCTLDVFTVSNPLESIEENNDSFLGHLYVEEEANIDATDRIAKVANILSQYLTL